jgi:hypothetical protein
LLYTGKLPDSVAAAEVEALIAGVAVQTDADECFPIPNARVRQRKSAAKFGSFTNSKLRLEASLQKDPHLRGSFQGLSDGVGSKSSQ